jgi:hypothetical protein
VKKATGHVNIVARELQIKRQDEWGCWLEHRTARYCRQNFALQSEVPGLNPDIPSRQIIRRARWSRPILPDTCPK